jgi:DNA sulfur modification protein DndC
MTTGAPASKSAFGDLGFSRTLEGLLDLIRDLYQADETPWTIGYSGGKDSTAVTQLVWMALEGLPEKARTKPVYVITTDTLVENPVVSAWVNRSLETMKKTAAEKNMPFEPHLLTPDIANTFWVNLIGRGYPAPRPKFRWCTERLKIKPSNRFIEDVAGQYGEVILLLGARRQESAVRAHGFNQRDKTAVREFLTPHPDLQSTLVFTPIEDWSNDDVWTLLLREKNPWNFSNRDLLSMYRGASEDNECPVVVDTSTPSCGNSRFGCWTCTLVDQDKSMSAMIQNDHEKEWMLPMLEIRNELDFRGEEARKKDRERRDFRRMGGHLQFYRDQDGNPQLIPGPYTQESREYWLRRVLSAQREVRDDELAPEYVQSLELVTLDELEEIRRIWITEKHEVEDLVPRIYEEEMGEPYPGATRPTVDLFEGELLELLRETCDGNRVRYETARNLLAIERRYRTMGNRRGLFKEIEKTLERGCFENREDALEFKRREAEIKSSVQEDDQLAPYTVDLQLVAETEETRS